MRAQSPYPMLTTYVISVRGRRRASIQNRDGDDLATAILAEQYCNEFRVMLARTDPVGAASVAIAITSEPDHYLEGQAYVNAYDR